MSWSGGDAVGADPTQHAVIWVAQTQIDRRSAKSAEEMHRGATPSCGESRNCAPADTSKPTTPYCSLFPPPRPHTFCIGFDALVDRPKGGLARSEEHPSELKSLMRTSYAVFGLKYKTTT